MTLTDNGDGTATLAGTPAPGTSGSYPITITAANGVSPEREPELHAHRQPGAGRAGHHQRQPRRRSPSGQAGTFPVTTTGNPTAALSATSSPALPSGRDASRTTGNGTATLAGTPPAGSQGTYTLTITAKNSTGTATQSFVLTVNSGLAITSADSATATSGKAFSFTRDHQRARRRRR